MSNIYDYINPQGLSPLARMIQSFIPSTASPDTPPPESAPTGGLPSGAPTGPPVQAFGIGPVATGIGDIVKSYLRAGQPSVWGDNQPPPQGGADARSGAYEPPQSETDATAAPGQPSPMQPRVQPQFPPSPIQPRTQEVEKPPDTSAPPPGPTKEPPRQEPYMRPRGPIHSGAWGRPDYALQGAARYPGMVPGPFMPQPHEWPGILNQSSQFLGNLSSGVIAPLARGMAMFSNEYWVAYRAQQTHKARMAAANFQLYAKKLAMKQAQENRDYSEAFAAYGPRKNKDGSDNSGDEEALRSAILEDRCQE